MKIRALLASAATVALAIAIPVVSSPAAHADQVTPGTYNTVPSQRILDTRSGQGAPQSPLAPEGTLTFDATAVVGNVPVSAVVLNVTAVTPKVSGYLTVYAAGAARPPSSNLNFQPRQNVPNLVVTSVSAAGKVSIYNGSTGTVDVLADIYGYYLGGANTGAGGTFVPLADSARLLDTRLGIGAAKARIGPKAILKLPVAGKNGIPADATGVAANITAVQSDSKGFITAYPGDPKPFVSNLNYEKREDRANMALIQLDSLDGSLSLYNGSFGTVDLIVDITGYYTGGASEADGSFVPSSPFRIYDTRETTNPLTGETTSGEPAAALTTSRIQVFPAGNPFVSFVKAVVVNVTAVDPQNSGFLTTYTDADGPLPSVSSSNFDPRHDVAGAVVVPVNADGTIAIYNGSFGPVDLVVDVTALVFALPGADAPAGITPQLAQQKMLASLQKFAANGPASRPVSVTTPTR